MSIGDAATLSEAPKVDTSLNGVLAHPDLFQAAILAAKLHPFAPDLDRT